MSRLVMAETSFIWLQVLGDQRLSVFVFVCHWLESSIGRCHTLDGFLLMLLGLIVKQNAQNHQDGPNGREAGDLVTEHDNTQPDGQGMLHCAGNAGKDKTKTGGSLVGKLQKGQRNINRGVQTVPDSEWGSDTTTGQNCEILVFLNNTIKLSYNAECNRTNYT